PVPDGQGPAHRVRGQQPLGRARRRHRRLPRVGHPLADAGCRRLTGPDDVTPLAAFPLVGSTVDITHWLRTGALEIVLIALGAVLASRLFTWLSTRITDRIDRRFRGSDDLVRTEASKHNHAMTQVITYVSIGVMY